jgi:hypothetical protein
VATLIVPRWDPEAPWPTLGPQVCGLIEQTMIHGPGPLGGDQAHLHDDWRALVYSMYEVYPKGHRFEGRRRFKRCSVCVRKGLAKTELMAWIALAELHPDGPVRCDGFDAHGNPVGRPVRFPYIPLLAVTVEQVEELAYGALHYMVTEGPDADLFDASLERIIRLGPGGAAEGRAVPLSNSPGARDGARTTFQGFDEPHRLFLPRQRAAHETMLGNMNKLTIADPWSLYVGTAGEPGEGSIAEDLHQEAMEIDAGTHSGDGRFLHFYRWAAGDHDLATNEGRIAAVEEATGPVGEFGPGQFQDIADNWTRKGADLKYIERVWLNRWTRSDEQAFDPIRRGELVSKDYVKIPPGSFITAGFDGARMRDSTGIVITDIRSGRQKLWALWEKPPELGEDAEWEIPEDQVTQAVEELMVKYDVWRLYADPPHWTETVGSWAGRWEQVEEWWTNRYKAVGYAIRAYREAMDSGAVTFVADDMEEAFARHAAAAGRQDINHWDDEGRRLWILRKLHPDRKFDAQMAAVLSWTARLDALRADAQPSSLRRSTKVGRLR